MRLDSGAGDQKPGEGKIPYLDGLRALSILMVLTSHTVKLSESMRAKWFVKIFFGVFGNGVLGVRIFFVISGFLITSLLLEEMNTTGRISISAFYKRRIARIFPVFYLYIATIAILTAFNVFHVSFLAFCAASSFAWNFSRMWEHLGSLGNADVLAHFWTLSIEEQFYLFWPSVLVLFGRRGAMRVALLCVVLFPVVRVAEYHSVLAADAGSLVHDDPAYVVYHEFSQDLILWGALGAFALRSEWFKQRAARGFWWKALSAGMLILGAAEVALRRFPDYTLTVSLESTVQALGVLLVMFWLLAAEGGIVRRLLEARPVVQIGLLSYSLYVWQQLYVHWPGRSLVFPVTLLLIVVTAVASYYLVEVPARKRIRHWFSQLQPAHNNSLAV